MSDKNEGYKVICDNRQARYLYEILVDSYGESQSPRWLCFASQWRSMVAQCAYLALQR
jgi:hypothetical protein